MWPLSGAGCPPNPTLLASVLAAFPLPCNPSLLPLAPHPLGQHRAPRSGARGKGSSRPVFDDASLSLVLKELMWQLPPAAPGVLGVPTAPPPQRGQGSPWRVGSTSAGGPQTCGLVGVWRESQAEKREWKTCSL